MPNITPPTKAAAPSTGPAVYMALLPAPFAVSLAILAAEEATLETALAAEEAAPAEALVDCLPLAFDASVSGSSVPAVHLVGADGLESIF